MSKRRNKNFLCDILEAIMRIMAYTKNMSFNKFMENYKTQEAVVRNLEVIGKAAKNPFGRLQEITS